MAFQSLLQNTPPNRQKDSSSSPARRNPEVVGFYSPRHTSNRRTPQQPSRNYGPPSGPATPSRSHHPIMRAKPLRNHLELKVQVQGTPPNWTTWDFYEFFKGYGEVTRVDIGRPGKIQNETWVCFQPPPANRDWLAMGLEVVDARGSPWRLRFTDKSIDARKVKSPNTLKMYDEQMVLALQDISFGVMEQENTMMVLQALDSVDSTPPQLFLDMQAKHLSFTFAMQLPVRPGTEEMAERRFKLRINFAQMHEVYMVRADDGCMCLVLPINSPPVATRMTSNIKATHERGITLWDERRSWFRQTDIDFNPTDRNSAIRLQKENCVIDLGRWTTYRLKLSQEIEQLPIFRDFIQALVDVNMSISHDRDIKFSSSSDGTLWDWLDTPQDATNGSVQSSMLAGLEEMTEESSHVGFPIRYQLEVCLSQGVLHECNIDRRFLHKLAAMDPIRAVKVLEKAADLKRRFYSVEDILRLLARTSIAEKRRPEYCTKIPSAVVTPTTIYYATPVYETSNRVIRQFKQHEDRFLRVKFLDERYKGKIWSTDDHSMDEVFSRIKRAMTHGIMIGDRHYEFLAFGSSQFREHGAYFFASTTGLTAYDIRQWMGNFTSIKVIAKYVARLGQCFTTTRAIPHAVKVERIPDVERNGFCFTDGVGMISPVVAKLAANHFGLPYSDHDYPSVFQFRMAGLKGVLAVDPSLKGMTIRVRPSQEKFPATYYGLEICRISQYSSAKLNTQLILVLSALRVLDEVFLSMQRNQVRDLDEAMTDEGVALRELQKRTDPSQTTLVLASMILDGFMVNQEPFMISCLRLWRTQSVKSLKEKAHILVDQAAFVLGCSDETQTLKGNFYTRDSNGVIQESPELAEIFLQVPDPDVAGKFRVVEGICALARNPSLHPGDIRTVRAVDVPALHHLKNCVVLPQTGDRDLANMCSGGDLDGDDYLVMWDPNLLPREPNHPPMDYTSPDPKLSEGDVTVDEMTSFFVNHIKNDNLASIAVAHRYWADDQWDGVKNPRCLELAQLHSKAVDYPKTGIPAEFPRHLRVSRWPHWAEVQNKSATKIYTSKKVLGRLYDQVKLVAFDAAWDFKFDNRILHACEMTDQLLQDAQEVKVLYDEAVRRIMAQYGIRTEFEVFTTFVLDHHRDSGDYKFAETMGEVSATLKQQHRDLCYEKAGTDAKSRDWEKMKPFLVAMYTVTAHEVTAAMAETQETKMKGGREVPVRVKACESMPFMSFPWIFGPELGQIATKGLSKASTMAMPRPVLPGQKPDVRQQMKSRYGGLEMPEDLPEVELDEGPGVRGGELFSIKNAVISRDGSGTALDLSTTSTTSKMPADGGIIISSRELAAMDTASVRMAGESEASSPTSELAAMKTASTQSPVQSETTTPHSELAGDLIDLTGEMAISSTSASEQGRVSRAPQNEQPWQDRTNKPTVNRDATEEVGDEDDEAEEVEIKVKPSALDRLAARLGM